MKNILITLFLIAMTCTIASAQWQRLPDPPGGFEVGDIVSFHDTLFAIVNDTVYHSADHGQTWNQRPDFGGAYQFSVVKGTLFCLCSGTDTLYRWRNGKWESFKSQVDLSLAMVDSTLFGCMWHELLISTDTGATWKQVVTDLDELQDLYAYGDTLFALPNPGQVGWPLYYSTDHGKNWEFASTFPTQGGFFYTLGAQESNDVLIYTPYEMNFSSDRGFDWDSIDNHNATFVKTWNNQFFIGLTNYDGLSGAEPNWCGLFKLRGSELVQILPDTTTSTMEGFAADDSFAYISTDSEGIWATAVTNPSLTLSVKTAQSESLATLSVVPNPTTGLITIGGASGTITVENILGETITTNAVTSDRNVTLDLSNEPAGIYLVRIADGTSASSVVKVIKM